MSKKKTKQAVPERATEQPADTTTETTPEKAPASSLQPYNVKIGESAENLRQRQEWFQKRSGKG